LRDGLKGSLLSGTDFWAKAANASPPAAAMERAISVVDFMSGFVRFFSHYHPAQGKPSKWFDSGGAGAPS
jgi:hypothetical protein